MARHALVVGSEVMTQASPDAILAAFEGSWDVAHREESIARLAEWGSGTAAPEDAVELASRTVFMDIYAAFARDHMTRFGSTAEQFAAVSAKNHMHSVHNPNAQFQRPFTVEEILGSKQVGAGRSPVPMCSPISDGAAAAVVSTLAECRRPWPRCRHPWHRARARRFVGRRATRRTTSAAAPHCSAYRGGGPLACRRRTSPRSTTPRRWARSSRSSTWGWSPTATAALPRRRGETAIGGRIPVNPSGGLESRGHPIGATGMAQIHELVTQLRGDAGARQVDGAHIALAENSGGLVGVEEAAVAVTLLQAPRT